MCHPSFGKPPLKFDIAFWAQLPFLAVQQERPKAHYDHWIINLLPALLAKLHIVHVYPYPLGKGMERSHPINILFNIVIYYLAELIYKAFGSGGFKKRTHVQKDKG
jgi:hypothetical protein